MSLDIETNSYGGGFATPPVDAANAFRAAMNAMARPGTVQDITGAEPPAGISAAAGCLLLTLCDPETGIYLAPDVDCPALRSWLAFHTGAPLLRPRRRILPWVAGRHCYRSTSTPLAHRNTRIVRPR